MTDKKTESLKLALDALEEIHPGNMTPMAEGNWNKAITAIREALAEQPAQLDPSVGTQVSKVWWDGNKLMAQPIPLEKLYKEPEQPAQQQEPVAFLANGTRFKMSFFENEDEPGTHVTCFEAFEKELDGRWVALVPAEDDSHLKLTSPPASKPLTDEQILRLVPGLYDCLCDPWDYNNSGDNYASIPNDMIRLSRAIEAAHGITGEQK